MAFFCPHFFYWLRCEYPQSIRLMVHSFPGSFHSPAFGTEFDTHQDLNKYKLNELISKTYYSSMYLVWWHIEIDSSFVTITDNATVNVLWWIFLLLPYDKFLKVELEDQRLWIYITKLSFRKMIPSPISLPVFPSIPIFYPLVCLKNKQKQKKRHFSFGTEANTGKTFQKPVVQFDWTKKSFRMFYFCIVLNCTSNLSKGERLLKPLLNHLYFLDMLCSLSSIRRSMWLLCFLVLFCVCFHSRVSEPRLTVTHLLCDEGCGKQGDKAWKPQPQSAEQKAKCSTADRDLKA